MEKNDLSSLEEKAKELQKILESSNEDDFDFTTILEEFDLDLEKLIKQ